MTHVILNGRDGRYPKLLEGLRGKGVCRGRLIHVRPFPGNVIYLAIPE
jgi:hypothetical protein